MGERDLFGYIKVDSANLLGKEYEAYKGIYCTLCKQLGKDYSVLARFILSYDCTFYAMLALDLAEEPTSIGFHAPFGGHKLCLDAVILVEKLSHVHLIVGGITFLGFLDCPLIASEETTVDGRTEALVIGYLSDEGTVEHRFDRS